MSAAMKILAIALVALQGYQAAAEKKPVVLLSESAAGPGPLTKVINLLKDMQKELAAEAKEDKKMHDQVACWCKTNKEGKTQQVEDAKKKDDQLVSDIQLHAATTSGLQVDLEDLKKDIAADEKALAEAVALRLKEGNTFHQGETDLIQAIESLKGAITTLSKHHDAMLQTDLDKDPLIVSMKPNLRRLIHRHRENLAFLLPEAKKDLEGFLNAQSYVFDSDPTLTCQGNG